MANDIFGANSTSSGASVISAHEMVMTVGGTNAFTTQALIQNVTIQYTQGVQIIRELGSKNYYYYAQLPSGTLSFQRLVSRSKSITKIFDPKVKNSIWRVPSAGVSSSTNPPIVLTHNPGGSAVKGGAIKYTLKQCIITNFGMNTSAEGSFVQENIQLKFGSMEST